jgi:hypothetical protein
VTDQLPIVEPEAEANPAIPQVTFHEKPWRHYKVNGLKVPSVTQVIGLLDKPALKFWAQRTAVEGVCTLALQYGHDDAIFRDPEALERAIVASGREVNAQSFVELFEAQECTLPFDRPGDVLRLLKSSEENINAVMRRAADRGSAIHGALESYAETGEQWNPDDYPDEYRGYLVSLAKWVVRWRPSFIASEVVVGSARHEFGGRLDHLLTLARDERTWLIDLKTNAKGEVYPRGGLPPGRGGMWLRPVRRLRRGGRRTGRQRAEVPPLDGAARDVPGAAQRLPRAEGGRESAEGRGEEGGVTVPELPVSAGLPYFTRVRVALAACRRAALPFESAWGVTLDQLGRGDESVTPEVLNFAKDAFRDGYHRRNVLRAPKAGILAEWGEDGADTPAAGGLGSGGGAFGGVLAGSVVA